MHLQQLKRTIVAVNNPAKRPRCLHMCRAQGNKDAGSVTNRDARPWLLSLCTASATALVALDVQAATALQAPGAQDGQAAVAMEDTMQMLERQHNSSRYSSELSSMMSVVDTLSLAAGEFLDITAAAADNSYNSQPHRSSDILAQRVSSQVVYSVMQHSTSTALLTPGVTAATSNQVEESQSTSAAAMAVASQMSQQALTVASEALRLAALLETQGSDPTYITLLRQIEEAAYSVSIVAADIAEPGVWLVDTEEPPGLTAVQPAAAEPGDAARYGHDVTGITGTTTANPGLILAAASPLIGVLP